MLRFRAFYFVKRRCPASRITWTRSRRGEWRLYGVAGIWRPLDILASRFALAAAVLLLAVSVYLAEFAPPFHMPAISSETSQTEVGAGMPEPPAQPSSQDEVLTSLAEKMNDF